eukprot:15574949-Heterocapsa_arctica.AAC.1
MVSTGYAYGGAALGKGAVNDRALVKDMANWLLEAGVVGKVRLRSDGEPAVSAVLKSSRDPQQERRQQRPSDHHRRVADQELCVSWQCREMGRNARRARAYSSS